MNILLIGSGGREHAFAWKLKQSSRCENLFISPGNPGTAKVGINVELDIYDKEELKSFIRKKSIGLVIVGPEEPLVKGLVDLFLNDNFLKTIPVVGPDKKGAQLEGSKDFAKEFMIRHNIPTAAYRTFSKEEVNEAISYLDQIASPYVLKADGLAAGKGVIITSSKAEAAEALREMFLKAKFGAAGNKVVIEEFLDGIEVSFFVLTDGESYKILPEAKDYKRIGEGDKGLNTGGMGAVSPVPFANEEFKKKVEERIIIPTIEGIKKDGFYYRGFVFIGLMNVKGDPKVIEYNVRMGDPETEAVLPRIESDFVELLLAAGKGELSNVNYRTTEKTAVTVVVASGGYPEEFEKGKKISIKEEANAKIFYAGVKSEGEYEVTSGGRVFAVTALGDTIDDAREMAYSQVDKISFDKKYFRRDIGKDLML